MVSNDSKHQHHFVGGTENEERKLAANPYACIVLVWCPLLAISGASKHPLPLPI